MNKGNTRYWKSIGDLAETRELSISEDAGGEEQRSMMEVLADEKNETASSRRDFLKWCGISFFSATVISACENPVKKAIPYLTQPEELTPGMATWYASTYQHGNEYCPVLIKTRDGRPIKIEGNPSSALTGGGSSARVQASVLSLYDDGARYHGPLKHAEAASWETIDREIIGQLRNAAARGEKMALVCPSLLSPSTMALIKAFREAFAGLEVITWDAVSYEAIRQAHKESFGLDLVPCYQFDQAELIVSFSADFLGTWVSPVSHAKQYASTRRISEDKPHMSRHIQFEGTLTLTGANADERVPVKPTQEIRILMALYDAMAEATGNIGLGAGAVDYDVQALAGEILDRKGKSIIVCGHNSKECQMLVNGINAMAGNYGRTLDNSAPLHIGRGDQKSFERFAGKFQRGEYSAVLFYNTNPVYHYHQPEMIREGLEKTALSVSFASTRNETASHCTYVVPDNHYLESWNDALFREGHYSLAQPAIHPLFKTRQFQDSLLRWMDREQDFHHFMKQYWQEQLFPKQDAYPDPASFWTQSLQAGVLDTGLATQAMPAYRSGSVREVAMALQQMLQGEAEMEFSAHPHLAMGDGTHANNPWLQEMPDPISSVTWDNYAALSPASARSLNLREGDIIRINGQGEWPVLVQPGQADGCLSLALGYGRTQAGKAGDGVGSNAFPLSRTMAGQRLLFGPVDSWEKVGDGHRFARTQTHFSMEGRAIVRESTLDKYRMDPSAGNELHAYHEKHALTLYPEDHFDGHHWALMIDLNACTGCSTCVIACQSENNVPVVGKDEVRRRRIMHWMRIDRYYNGEADKPGIVFQPVMCMHCDHAPCENVCPVAATMHSREGLNQMAYNRCVGTKFCINNCPYKVRRFNWFEYARNEAFDYHMNSDLGRMVLNPDVTVRERGVVEKCSFCVQRIQAAKVTAKNERRRLKDGEVLPACVQSCPAEALVFGDLNDKSSRVAQLIKDPRNYHLLEELHTLPSVGYLTKIRNPE